MSTVEPQTSGPSRPATVILKNFSPAIGVRESNILSVDKAHSLHDSGMSYVLLFGPAMDPSSYIEVFKTRPDGSRRLDVQFLDHLARTRRYVMYTEANSAGRNGLLLAEYKCYPREEGDRFYHLFVSDALTRGGDLPTLTFDEVGSSGESHAISVSADDFFFGACPTFDDLVSGRFVDGLPKITLPPKHLWDKHIPQIVRTSDTPRRTPIGHFPW